MQIRVGQFARAAACAIAGPAGNFLYPALAVGAEIVHPLMEGHPLAAAVAIASVHVFSHLSGDRAQKLIEKLGEPDSIQGIEKVLAESMRLALKKARDGLKPQQRKQYGEFFDLWNERLKSAGDDVARISALFKGKEAFDPVILASASAEDAWVALRATGILGPILLPKELDAYLAQTLPGYIQQAVSEVLLNKENREGWLAWQQRFLESTYFEVRGLRADLAKLIEDLANLNFLPGLLQKLQQEIVGRTQEIRKLQLDSLEEIRALRELLAVQRGEPRPKAEPAGYLRTLWGRTQTLNLEHFTPPDGTVRQFFIERLYTKLTTVIAGERQDRLREFEKGNQGDLALHEALRRHRLLLLVGDPGSGKTTFLKRIAFELCHVGLGRNREAGVADDGRSRSIELLMDCDWETLPILVDAKVLANHIWNGGVAKRGALADPAHPDWLFHYLAEESHIESEYFVQEAERGCVVMVDAFDEVPDEVQRAKIGELLKNLATDERYGKTRIVGTSRPGEHGGLTGIAQFQTAEIARLGDREIAAFVKNWSDAVHPTMPSAAAALAKTLQEEIRRPQVRLLARNPMMLTALAVLHFVESKRLPEQRSELYKYILEWLAKVRAAKRDDRRGHQDFLFKMRLLAMTMSTGEEKMRAEIGLDEAVDELKDEFEGPTQARKREATRTFLIEEETHSGMIIKSGDNVRFWHLTFREALAAQQLAKDGEWKTWLFEQDKLYHRHWRETVLLLAGELRSSGSDRPVHLFLNEMLERAEASGAGLPERARCVGLMGLLLKDLDAWHYLMTEDLSRRYHTMLGLVEEIFDKEKACQIPFQVRLDAANALGQAGDPRLERNNRIPLPGDPHFLMGAQKDDPEGPNHDEAAYENESPVREVEVAPFSIGRYPVTVAEYERFIGEGGYTAKEHWHAGGFGEFAEPDEWQDQLEYPNRPVVGVSWFEAAAYCAWAEGRLPKEKEWEYAARAGRPGVRYPWGNDDPEKDTAERRANYGYEGSPGAPTPVGLYPSGATPTGIHDLAGNVWEWVEDNYGDESETKVLRGGAFYYDTWYLRVSSRFRYVRVVRDYNFGFRCVWESRSP